MESPRNSVRHEDRISVSKDEDRTSALPDELLLHILEFLAMRMAVQTSVLSTRWRHLPHQLSYLQMNALDFGGPHCTLDQVMAAYTDATRRLLSPRTCKCIRTIKTLQLSFYLTDPYLSSIGHAVGDAVKSGEIEFLEFAIYTHVEFPSEAQLVLFGPRFMSFLHACPGAFKLLTKLTLQNLVFEDSDVPNILNTCNKLQLLSLRSCELGRDPVLKIDVPCSELRAPEFIRFGCAQVELICVPKLMIAF